MKSFIIVKNTKKTKDIEPDYNILGKENEQSIKIGACWLKDSKGQKFFSCRLNNGYTNKEGKIYSGYEINKEKNAVEEKAKEEIPF